MPFVRISLLRGRPPEFLRALADGVHATLVETFGVPPEDRFQTIHQLAPEELFFDRGYLGVARGEGYVLVEITAGRPRPATVKQATYRRLVERLAERPGIRPEDVMVVVQHNNLEDWSFGAGRAQMVEAA